MAAAFANALTGTIDRLVRWIVVPLTGVIPVLVSSGALLALFAGLWLVFAGALAIDSVAIETTWRWIASLALPVQAVGWLLFMPLFAGMWVWTTDWPVVLRLVLVAGIGVWNVLVFLPHRPVASTAKD